MRKESVNSAFIVGVDVDERILPLRVAYGLSYGTLSFFPAITLRLLLSTGEESIGEVVPLPGYSTETADSIIFAISHVASLLIGKTLHEGRRHACNLLNVMPMAASAVLGALDYPVIRQRWSTNCRQFKVPILMAVSASDPSAIDQILGALANGYGTVKVKLGEQLEADLEFIDKCVTLARLLPRLRFDANQAYTLAQARRVLAVLERLPSDKCDLFEQPLPAGRWKEMCGLCRDSWIPLMLDEGINTMLDIEKAAQAGCRFVKLKLCKQGGVWEVLLHARHACRLGMGVVFGNGVATDVANFLELVTAARYSHFFYGPLECVGFSKISEQLGENRLMVRNGFAVIERIDSVA